MVYQAFFTFLCKIKVVPKIFNFQYSITLVQKRFFEKLIENVLPLGNLRFDTTKTPTQGGQDYGTLCKPV